MSIIVEEADGKFYGGFYYDVELLESWGLHDWANDIKQFDNQF